MDVSTQHGIRDRLKQETRAAHHDAEAAVQFSDRTANRRSYIPLLARLFGFYEPAEARLRAAHGDSLAELRLDGRMRTPMLQRDLLALGLSPADIQTLPRCSTLPHVTSVPAALGYLYVVEGATLGGAIIARRLEELHQMKPESGAAFFTCYGDRSSAMWREYLAALNAAVISEVEADETVQTAQSTFAAMTEWLLGTPE